MQKKKRPTDPLKLAKLIGDIATGTKKGARKAPSKRNATTKPSQRRPGKAVQSRSR